MSLYLVAGQWRYRGHEPGTTFEETLDPDAEERALASGAIRVLERTTPSLQPGSYQLPDGWANHTAGGIDDV